MSVSKEEKRIQVICDEDGEHFICFGTMNKKKALSEMRKYMKNECGLDPDYLPSLEDIYLNPLWYGISKNNPDENWYYWENPPMWADYIGSCYRYDVF